MRRHYYLSAAFLLLSVVFHSSSFAEDSSKNLKQEVHELKEMVQELRQIIQTQNQRIESLEKGTPAVAGLKSSAPSSLVPKSAPLPQEKETLSRAAFTEPTASPSQTSAANGESISPEASPTAPEDREYRQLGFWKVPTPKGSAWKLLPDISVIGVFSGAYFSQEPGEEHEGEEHGHEHGTGHDPSRTGFNLQEIEVAFQSIIDPYIRADIFLAFHESGVELEEGYITTLSLPKGLQLKAGKFLMPFGRQNQKHLESWAFVNNNLVNQDLLGPEQFNELGVETAYLFPTPFFLQAQFVFSQGTNENNFDGERKEDFAYTGRLSTSFDLNDHLTALLGTSASFGFNNTGPGNLTSLYGGDFLLKWKPSADKGIEWQTEYIYRRREVPGDTEAEGGLYSYLIGNWSKRWGAGMRLDVMGIPSAEEDAYRLSPIIAFRPSEYFRIRAQYDFKKVRGEDPLHAAYLQWIFNMGPHGAHQF